MLKRFRKHADFIGITGSTLCLIHCIVTSSIAIFSAGMGYYFEDFHGHSHDGIWMFWDITFIIASVLAVYYAAKMTHNKTIRNLLWFFMSIFLVTTLGKISIHSEILEYASYAASLALIATHLTNLKAHKHSKA